MHKLKLKKDKNLINLLKVKLIKIQIWREKIVKID